MFPAPSEWLIFQRFLSHQELQNILWISLLAWKCNDTASLILTHTCKTLVCAPFTVSENYFPAPVRNIIAVGRNFTLAVRKTPVLASRIEIYYVQPLQPLAFLSQRKLFSRTSAQNNSHRTQFHPRSAQNARFGLSYRNILFPAHCVFNY